MPYKVKQNRYSVPAGRVVERLVNPADVIFDALTVKETGYSTSIRERLSIEEKIEANGHVVSKLIARLLDAEVISPEDVQTIVGYPLQFKGELVRVDNPDE